MIYNDILKTSEFFLSTLDKFKITSSEFGEHLYLDEDKVACYWYQIMGVEDEYIQ